MIYLKEIPVYIEGIEKILYMTDDLPTAQCLRDRGEAVLIYRREGDECQSFAGFPYAAEGEEPDGEYAERVYRRLKGLPWTILETARCLIRETTVEDVDAFYQIYSHPEITRYTEALYPDVEEEKRYVREYIEKIYGFYEFGVWTVTEKESGAVIGRAGFSCREGSDIPELGFIIGVPWQRRGYAEEVCRGILDYGFSQLGFDRVQALAETRNEPSLKLLDKLGFRAEEELELGGRGYFRLVRECSEIERTAGESIGVP